MIQINQIIHTITPTKISVPRAMARAKHPLLPQPLSHTEASDLDEHLLHFGWAEGWARD